MSTRQLKRLEALEALQGKSGQGDSSSDDDLPTTMKRPGGRRTGKPRQPVAVGASPTPEATVSTPLEQPRETVEVASSSSAGKHAASTTAKPKSQPPAPQKAASLSTATTKSATNTKGKGGGGGGAKSSSTRSRASRKRADAGGDDDDDEEFEAVMREYATTHCEGLKQPGGSVGLEATSAVDEERLPTLATLLTADRKALDPRAERIRAFGANSVESLAPQHPQVPKLRPSLLHCPNPNEFPRFDPCGLRIEVASTQSRRDGAILTLYRVDTSDSHFQAGCSALNAAINDNYGGMQGLIDVMHKYPYHLPTLIQLHRNLMSTGDGGIAQKCLDRALYCVGIVAAALLGKPGIDVMLLPSPGASMLFEVLRLGIYSAMKKGCAKTALELVKQMLSLDSGDSERVLLFADYIAIRASAFDWIIQVYAAAERSRSTAVHVLASWRLNAALAAHLRSKRLLVKQRGDVVSSALPRECAPIVEADGIEWLKAAVCRHSTAAIAVADRAGIKLTEHHWAHFVNTVSPQLNQVIANASGSAASFAERHTDGLFAERCGELWKMPSAMEFLTSAVASVVATSKATGGMDVLTRLAMDHGAFVDHKAADELLLHYREATLDDVMFNVSKGIPRELLEEGPTEEEHMAAAAQAQREQLPPEILESLDRFEAAFGPLPADVPAEQRLAIYEDMLQDRIGRLGNNENALALFLRSLLPWNTPREMALRQALADAGVVDPTVQRRREARQREAEVDVEFVEYQSSDED